MAGDYDRNGIRSVGQAHRPRSFGVANAPGQFAIGNSLTIRDITQTADFHLERSAVGRQWKRETFQFSCKVRFELADGLGQWSSILEPCRIGKLRWNFA